jgi:hypothetical protein
MLVNGSSAIAGDDAAELTQMLNEFLAGASIDDAAAHDRFWADDLIYTSSSGERIGKADIMGGLSASANANKAEADKADAEAVDAEKIEAGEAATVYTAEEIRIQQYGDTAIVAFKLVGTTSVTEAVTGAGPEVLYYYNTGTFLRRDGVWQVVAWQATRIPVAG